MPGPRAGLQPDEPRLVRLQLARAGVELVGDHLVQAEIAHEGEAVVGAEGHALGVGTLLPFGMDALAGVLPDVGGLAQLAVRRHREDRDAAAVVGDQQVLPLAIEGQVAGTGAHRGSLAQQGQLSRPRSRRRTR